MLAEIQEKSASKKCRELLPQARLLAVKALQIESSLETLAWIYIYIYSNII